MNKGNQLGNEQVLSINEYLQSPNQQFILLLHSSGCLVLYCTLNQQILWHSNSFSQDIDAVRMQNDGNLVVYYRGGKKAAWASDTKDKGGHRLELQDDGNLVIYKKDGSAVWATGTFGQQGDTLMHLEDRDYEQNLRLNEYLLSANGRYAMLLKENGDLVIRETEGGKELWSAGKAGSGATELRMQDDGNLVLYKGLKKDPVWATGTHGKGSGARLVLENYGDLVLYDKQGYIIWENQQPDTTNWMSKLDKKLSLKEICIPGSHDAGMYTAYVEPVQLQDSFSEKAVSVVIASFATFFGEHLAKTQGKTIYEQLKLGARYFDLRPKTWNDERYIFHGPAYGPKVTTVLSDVKKFMKEAKNETVILNWSHFEKFNSEIDEDFINCLYDTLNPFLFDADTLDAPTKGSINSIFEVPLEKIRGKVILLIEGNSAMYKDAVLAKQRKGIYYLGDANDITTGKVKANRLLTVNIYDKYADKEDYDEMKKDQEKKFAGFNNNNELFLLNWTLTTNEEKLVNDIKKATNTSSKTGIAIQAIAAVFTLGSSLLISAPAMAVAVKQEISKHSIDTFAGKANHRLLGDRTGNEFIFRPNKKGRMVNIINTDYVELVHTVRACLRVMNS